MHRPTHDMSPAERAAWRAERAAEQAERDARAKAYAAEHPLTDEERAKLPRISF